ncbi:MAG: peptidase domain-containing ABC transporter [Janthinobacterium sp.]|jgi:ATP-binding cassette subfamily B protein RaxB
MKTILQTEKSECGIASLAMICNYFGYHVGLPELRRKFSISLKGTTLAQLVRYAGAMHMAARPLRLELDQLAELKCPAILHWNLNHFVVLKSVKRKFFGKLVIKIIDPAIGERVVSIDEVSKNFTGVALELTPNDAFEVKQEAKKISIRALTGRISGLRRALVQIFLLAITLELFAIVMPLFNQFVIDEVIVAGDKDLLQILVLGFSLLLLTQTAIGLARSWFLMRWSIDIGFQWGNRVFAHLTRLPISYFEKRHVGDVVSRFSSMSAIQSTLTNIFVESVIDGLMASFALIIMIMYSPRLTAIVVMAALCYGLLRWVFYQPLREASLERILLSSKENTHFLETIRAITPLKLFGREDERGAYWRNLKLDVINRDIRTQKLGIVFKVSNGLISGVQGLSLLYLGAMAVMGGSMTVGMLMAFVSYSSTFSGRVFSLIDVFVNFRMLGMHAERLADIVLEPVEPEMDFEMDTAGIQPAITLKNVSFRYAEGEPWVLKDVNLHIPAGQSVALVGASGCGKTTMCKIITGLLLPSAGEVLIDNIPIQKIGLRGYRKLVGTVMQDDVLLAGSIMENISFFDTSMSYATVEECAKLAAIHEEIARMPMGYQTLVGDMGSSLSGGQKQRILLARALYKQPKILALDEATSHLDIANEYKVNLAINKMNLTRIMVAHRPETIKMASRVVHLIAGQVHETLCEKDGAQV